MKEIRDLIRFWEVRRGRPLALATLVAARGSSYRRPGARMLIDATGEAVGGVSAGCIEEEVIVCAQEVLRSGQPRLMTFDTRRRFGCHGVIEIFVEPAVTECMAELRECLNQRQSCHLQTVVQGEGRGTRVVTFDSSNRDFVQTIEPALRLVLIGSSSDTDALRAQATLLGWDVLQHETAASAASWFDHRTAVVIATHNFGRDCAALRDLLPTSLRYIGLIGSRRRRDDLLFDVMQSGVACHPGLFAPAGLHLGADAPEEIALSIVAEIQRVFGSGSGQSLRHRKAPIHVAAAELPCAESAA